MKKGVSESHFQRSFQLSKEYEFFIGSDLREFRGKWIAIKGKGIVSSNKEIDTLVRDVQRMGVHNPFYTKIPTKKQLLIL